MSEILCKKCGGNLDERENEWSENADGDLVSESYYCEGCKKYIRLVAKVENQEIIKVENQEIMEEK